MKQYRAIKLFLLVTFLEGIGTGAVFFSSPSMEKNIVLWGFSTARLTMGFLILCILIAIGTLLLISRYQSEKFEEQIHKIDEILLKKYMLLPITLFSGILLFFSIGYAFIPNISLPSQYTILYLIYPRVLPMVIWIGLICLQMEFILLYVYWENIKSFKFYKLSWQYMRKWLKYQKIIQPFLLIICSTLSMLPNLPKYTPVPSLDSGVFLFFGDQILKGKLPYRDLWDHKPPAIFYTDALGLWIGDGSRIGVWVLEVLAIVATGLFAYYFLKKYFGNWSAMFASIISIANLIFVMDYGNYTEEFTLPFQYFALFLFSLTYRQKSSNWLFLFIGISAGIAFMYKQTMIGIWIVIFIMLIIRSILDKDWRNLCRRLLLIVAGASSICLLVAMYFAYYGQLIVFWDDAFRFNFIYTEISLIERIQKLHNVWERVSFLSPYYTLGLFSWIIVSGYLLIQWISTRLNKNYTCYLQFIVIISTFIASGSFLGSLFHEDQIIQFIWIGFFIGLFLSVIIGRLQHNHKIPTIFLSNQFVLNKEFLLPLQIAVFGFPIEILLISASGRYYLHYYMGLILPFSILIAFLLWLTSKIEINLISRFIYGTLLLTLGVFAGLEIDRMMVVNENIKVTDTANYILDHSDDDDFVLVWGAQTLLNYLTQREEPTRFVYTIPLYTQGYVSDEMVTELYTDLITKSPKLIVDVKTPPTPFISFSETGECLLPQSDFHESMQKIFIYVCQNYHQKRTFGKEEWVVYARNDQ